MAEFAFPHASAKQGISATNFNESSVGDILANAGCSHRGDLRRIGSVGGKGIGDSVLMTVGILYCSCEAWQKNETLDSEPEISLRRHSF